MKGVRATVRGWLVVVAMAATACGPMDDARIASDVEREMDGGRAYATALVAAAESDPTASEAIAVGYMERLRLGLGSPFRLIEYALRDPRLEKAERERLAWALLARTVDGQSHHIDPRALVEGDVERAVRHLTLIEGAVRGSADPEAGALAVRLAYAMAAAESSVSESFRDRVSRVASLVRDRVQSQADAERLLRAAGDGTDAMALMTAWRVERKFEVERPTYPAATATVERDAVTLAPHLLESIREIRRRPRGGPVRMVPEPRQRPLLSEAAARLLALESGIYNAPPQTPVTIAVRTYGRAAEGAGTASDAAARFFENALNEERLAAEHALLLHRSGLGMGSAPRLALLESAVGLRAYAQERPWFPGFDGPAQRDLEDRFGLASVTFPADVPAQWRPYYRRMLESALSDLRRVLPSLDVRGLHVRFAHREGSPGTLAVHDPRSRTMYIPTTTGAGTIAHEVAHDMDWQTALRRYRVRGDYGTDRAVRLADERLARVLRGLTPASLEDVTLDRATHATRPAEVFARSIDWFVAVALAREGRRNGYLSSVQDDVLTGYGTVTPPDVTGTAGEALVTLLDEVAPVYPETRRWFLGSFGRLRAPTVYDLTRRVVEAPLHGAAPADLEPGPAALSIAMTRFDALEEVRDSVLDMIDGCRAVAYDNGTTAARRRFVRLTTRARARGVAVQAASGLVGQDGRAWVEARLEGRTRDPAPDSAVVDLLQVLVDRVEAADGTRQAAATAPLEVAVPAAGCGPLPFLPD